MPPRKSATERGTKRTVQVRSLSVMAGRIKRQNWKKTTGDARMKPAITAVFI